MALKRREFIKIALKTTVIVGSGSIMSFANQGLALAPKSGIKLRLACVSDGHWGQPDTDYQAMHEEMNNWLINENESRGFLMLNTADENGKYICPDLDWASKHLEKYKKKKHLFVFMHITPLKWTEYGISCPELVEMFTKQNNLKAVFHGHDHDQDNVKVNEGKPYFFDAHVGGSWGTKYRGYRIVEVISNDEIITYQVNPEAGEKVNRSNL